MLRTTASRATSLPLIANIIETSRFYTSKSVARMGRMRVLLISRLRS
jgi:hypothetical protein